jgi:excinuclease ABC subunit C
MLAASKAFAFEEAAEYRDLLSSVKKIAQKQKITSQEMGDRDVIAVAKAGGEAVVQVFFIRGGKLIGREHFHFNEVADESRQEIITAFVKQFYSGTPFIPKELFLQENLLEEELLLSWLSEKKGQRVYVRVPKKGEKERLVELAEKNASLILQQDSEKIKREEARTLGAVKEIAALLDLPQIRRIESYDISNTNGFESVGSMVVFENGKPKKNDYRKFKIKSILGPDDYGSMREILTRRFTHGLREQTEGEKSSFSCFPDLIMMDGGKGQVNVAKEVLSGLGLSIPICGMVKDDRHRTRGLYFENQELPMEVSGEGFRLVTRIQDETHRFAIEYHRSLRGKAQVHSILDDIEGIGPTRRRALIRHFKSIEALKEATLEEIEAAPAMNKRAAKSVYEFFHP